MEKRREDAMGDVGRAHIADIEMKVDADAYQRGEFGSLDEDGRSMKQNERR